MIGNPGGKSGNDEASLKIVFVKRSSNEWNVITLVNLARFYKISPEEAMLHANEKFARRFQFVEESVKNSGKAFSEFTLDELDAFWNEAKRLEKGE